MNDERGRPLSRDETELITYFRGLPLQQQMDVLDAAESRFNALERMKELASRHVERNTTADGDIAPWH